MPTPLRPLALLFASFVVAAAPVSAEETGDAIQAGASETSEAAVDAARVEAVEEKVDILAEEMARLEASLTVPEELELTSFGGLGPAASKVYYQERGLSIGGYGEVLAREFVNEEEDKQSDMIDALRAVVYVGYKFNDKWVFNSELEFEHGGTGGGGSVSTEFATIDYLHSTEINARAGVLLAPMGFVNEIHEPTAFFGADRPQVEKKIMPSTWRENGAGIFGTIADRVHYKLYVMNSFDGSGFSNDGVRGGRQKASEALAEHYSIIGRIDVDAAPGLRVGGSFFTGETGQNQDFTSSLGAENTRSLPDARLTIYEVHAQYKAKGLSLRGLWSQSFLDDSAKLSRRLDKGFVEDGGDRVFEGMTEGIASRMQGWYVEAAYDVLPIFMPESRASLEPYVRFESYDTQKKVKGDYKRNRSKDIDLLVAGVQWKPLPQIVFKVDYSNFAAEKGKKADQVNMLVGYAF